MKFSLDSDIKIRFSFTLLIVSLSAIPSLRSEFLSRSRDSLNQFAQLWRSHLGGQKLQLLCNPRCPSFFGRVQFCPFTVSSRSGSCGGARGFLPSVCWWFTRCSWAWVEENRKYRRSCRIGSGRTYLSTRGRKHSPDGGILHLLPEVVCATDCRGQILAGRLLRVSFNQLNDFIGLPHMLSYAFVRIDFMLGGGVRRSGNAGRRFALALLPLVSTFSFCI